MTCRKEVNPCPCPLALGVEVLADVALLRRRWGVDRRLVDRGRDRGGDDARRRARRDRDRRRRALARGGLAALGGRNGTLVARRRPLTTRGALLLEALGPLLG